MDKWTKCVGVSKLKNKEKKNENALFLQLFFLYGKGGPAFGFVAVVLVGGVVVI